MDEFMDIVLTKNVFGLKRVFILPEFTHISPDDIVAEKIENGERHYKVLASCTLRKEDEKTNFIMKLCEPVKAYKIYRAAVMDYNEQEGKTDE